jgi:hypothetical protein
VRFVRAFCITLGLCGLLARAAFAQGSPARVAGTVRDTAGRPLAAVQVWVVGTKLVAQTDSLGHYQVDSVPGGPARLRTAIAGYVSIERATVLPAGEGATLDLRVVPLPLSDGGNVVRSVPLEQADSQ